MPTWMTDPYGFVLAFGLVAAVSVVEAVRWVVLGGRSIAQGDSLRARMLRGMQESPGGQRWLRHPWLTGAGTVILVIVFGAIFNVRFRT